MPNRTAPELEIAPRQGETIDAELERLRELHDQVSQRIATLERRAPRRPAVVTVPATTPAGERRVTTLRTPPAPSPVPPPALLLPPRTQDDVPTPSRASRLSLLTVEIVAYGAIVAGLLAYFLR